MSMFPGPGAVVDYNDAGEPLGWDYPSYDEPPDPDDWYEQNYWEPDNPCDYCAEEMESDEEVRVERDHGRHRYVHGRCNETMEHTDADIQAVRVSTGHVIEAYR